MKIPKLYKYEVLRAIDRAQQRANREHKRFEIVISKRRFVQISQVISSGENKDWIRIRIVKPQGRPLPRG